MVADIADTSKGVASLGALGGFQADDLTVTKPTVDQLLYRCIRELAYVQAACHSDLCASSNGRELIKEGMKVLCVRDLAAETLAEARA